MSATVSADGKSVNTFIVATWCFRTFVEIGRSIFLCSHRYFRDFP